jgi:two-component system sensor histidine kinase KdpD
MEPQPPPAPAGRARRSWRGAAVAVAGLALTTCALLPVRGSLSLASVALLFLLPVVATAAIGGSWPALAGAVTADLLVNFFFVPPYHTLAVDRRDNVITLIVYIAVAAAVAVAVDAAARQRAALASQEARARELLEIDRLRAALLGAVGHDLRTPLAGIKAAISSLRQPDVAWAADDEAELLATVEESTDRLSELVENLLSLSRLQAGALSVTLRPVPLDAVVAQALLHSRTGQAAVEVDVPDDLPLAYADPGLLERVIANLVGNATKASGYVLLRGRDTGGRIELRVVDRGPGVPAADRERMFTPFQRLDDHGTDGLGLGLAIARGFTEAMGGTLTPSDTPGGGLTMTVTVATSGAA